MDKLLGVAGVAFMMIVFFLIFFCVYGWVFNLIKLTKTDFQPPYKAEVLRGIGVITVIPGVIMGHIEIED